MKLKYAQLKYNKADVALYQCPLYIAAINFLFFENSMLYLELGKQQKMHISLFYEKANTLFLSWYATRIDFNSNFKKDVNKKGHNLLSL